MTVAWWAWALFVAFIAAMLLVDLFVLHRQAHEVSLREAALWTGVWVTLGVGFAGLVWLWWGPTAGGEYLAGYLIEESLSLDNMFVFALIFDSFGVPAAYQHRVLFWGIFGALVCRAVFIAAGVALLDRFGAVTYVFGAFLVFTGVKLAVSRHTSVDPARNPVLRLVSRLVPMTPEYRGQRLFVRDGGRRLATPLLAVLVAIETTDVLFAVDSIPAIFAVTTDPFLVFSSNAFAILGLRSLYFLLAGMMSRFAHLRIGLAAVLVFVGAKLAASEIYHVPVGISLAVIAVLIGGSIVASVGFPAASRRSPRHIATGKSVPPQE
jgi:tellurite resistance protein TerC